MRFLISLENPDTAKGLSALLNDRNIDHELEVKANTNWGDDHYGDKTYVIWVINEENFDPATKLCQRYLNNPSAEELKLKSKSPYNLPKAPKPPPLSIPLEVPPLVIPQEKTFVTRVILFICVALFSFQMMTTPSNPGISSELWVPSPINQWLLIDFPKAAELYTKVISLWQASPDDGIPASATALLEQAFSTPYWKGLYDITMANLKGGTVSYAAPLFEKVGQGEIWRLFTPALLHANLLHIAFNMMWFWMLGKELENNLGRFKYILLIVIIGVIANISQYLMTGFQFLGFSGIIAGMALYIGERQKHAPWEGFTLDRSIYLFLVFYIMVLAIVEIFTSILIFYNWGTPLISIANTAHIMGAATGYLLGKVGFKR